MFKSETNTFWLNKLTVYDYVHVRECSMNRRHAQHGRGPRWRVHAWWKVGGTVWQFNDGGRR